MLCHPSAQYSNITFYCQRHQKTNRCVLKTGENVCSYSTLFRWEQAFTTNLVLNRLIFSVEYNFFLNTHLHYILFRSAGKYTNDQVQISINALYSLSITATKFRIVRWLHDFLYCLRIINWLDQTMYETYSDFFYWFMTLGERLIISNWNKIIMFVRKINSLIEIFLNINWKIWAKLIRYLQILHIWIRKNKNNNK